MKLRVKTLLAVGVTLLVVIVVLHSITRSIIHQGFRSVEVASLSGFGRIEHNATCQNVQRVSDALKLRIAGLSTKVFDWAQWDDSYQFVVDHNEAFIESNCQAEALTGLKINLLAIVDKSQHIVWSMVVDLESGEEVPMSEGLKHLLAPGSPLYVNQDPDKDMQGIVMLPENPLLVAARPIATSTGEGPARGTMIFARYLDDAEYAALSDVTHLTIRRHRMTDSLELDCAEARTALLVTDTPYVKVLGDNLIAGYTIIKDIQEAPALILRVDIPRDIHQQGLATMRGIQANGRQTLIWVVVSIIGAGVLLMVVIALVIDKSVLSRLARLSQSAEKIGKTGDFRASVDAAGKDEIASLGGSVNAMLAALGATHAAIESRNAEMRLLMNTVPTGLLTLDESLKINPELSESVQRILGCRELAGKEFVDALGLRVPARAADGAKLWEFVDFFRQGLLPEQDMAGLNPFEELEHSVSGQSRFLRFRYYLIARGIAPNHILAVIEDITEEKRLSAEVSRSQSENMQLKAIAENPELFREFLVETRHILKNVESLGAQLVPGTDCTRVVNEMFRGVHTIKGVAGSFGLFTVGELSGNLETALSPLRTAGSVVAQELIDSLRVSMTRLVTTFAEVVQSTRRFLGDDIERESGILVQVSLDRLKGISDSIKGMCVEEELKNKIVGRLKGEIIHRLKELQCIPASKGLARSVKIVPGLIGRLGKNAAFAFVGQDTLIDSEVAHELNGPMVHLLRNAFDHGLEGEEERSARGKPAKGTVTLTVQQSNGTLRILVEDDGRGLDPQSLKKVAVRKGMLTEAVAATLTRSEAIALILKPGFTTSEQVTEFSGRGVGLDAVVDVMKTRLSGTLAIESEIGTGTRFVLEVPGSHLG